MGCLNQFKICYCFVCFVVALIGGAEHITDPVCSLVLWHGQEI